MHPCEPEDPYARHDVCRTCKYTTAYGTLSHCSGPVVVWGNGVHPPFQLFDSALFDSASIQRSV